MSNPDKPFVLQHAVPSGVVATRWWWVRHAPVRGDGGNIYGQKDMPCDCSDSVVFDAVGRILPRDAVWFASKLQRTHQTAQAIWAAGFPKPDAMPHEADLNEQHLADTRSWDAFPDYVNALRTETLAFRGQVALVHGDSHYFKMDKPINGPSDGVLANFTRVETFGARNTHWVSATIDANNPNLFEFEPRIVPANTK